MVDRKFVEAADALASLLRLIRNRAPLHRDYERDIDEADRVYRSARSSLAAEKAEEPDAPGIAEAPDGTLPCVYCSNENLCVEIRDDKHPGMLGFSVRCGSAFCGARGPVRPAQMDAVEEWNRAYRWVHPPKAEEPAPSPQAQGEVCECGHPWSEHVDGDDAERHARRYGWTCVEDGCECAAIPSKPLPAPAESAPAQDGEPSVEECLRVAHEAIKAKHPHTAALAAELTEDERECVMAVRALCLASRAPSPVKVNMREHPNGVEVVEVMSDASERLIVVVPLDCWSRAPSSLIEAGKAMRDGIDTCDHVPCRQSSCNAARAWDAALAEHERSAR